MAMSSRYNEIEIEVTVSRKELLERLKANRIKHEAEFAAAIAAWQKDLQKALQEIDASEHFRQPKSLEQLRDDCPRTHVHQYDQAIDMFEMCVNETIKLDSDSFNTFCRDEWGWKHSACSNPYFQLVMEMS